MAEPSGIHVADYDPSWPRQAAIAIDALRAAAPGLFVRIEHIGSTAVPGLAAKPVIDLMAAVHDLTHAAPHQAALTGLGFHPHDNGMNDRLLYVRADNAVRSHILHVVTLESWPTRNQRIFRDYLRAHPADAIRYAQLNGQSSLLVRDRVSMHEPKRRWSRNLPTVLALNSACLRYPCGRSSESPPRCRAGTRVSGWMRAAGRSARSSVMCGFIEAGSMIIPDVSVSPRFLTQDDRIAIADGPRTGKPPARHRYSTPSSSPYTSPTNRSSPRTRRPSSYAGGEITMGCVVAMAPACGAEGPRACGAVWVFVD
ncbi:GrpB family protein [Streptomyces sp. NPDC006476]|uniref:GrpB family protein n=1 Tax=Streptomyces sp. NPDC006476 TaxID=3157175 RepID=UPI0033A26CD3